MNLLSIFGLGRSTPPAPVGTGGAARMRSEYMRGGRGVAFAGWRPALRDADQTVSSAWSDAAARTLDVLHNSGWLSGAVDQAVANTVGSGLVLKSQPETVVLGWDEPSARAWSRMVEARFSLWASSAYDCDIEGRRDFGAMQAAQFRTWFPYGEHLTEIAYRRRPGNSHATKLRLVQPHRIVRTSDRPTLVDGVRMDRDGLPIAYRTRRTDAQMGDQEVEIAARDRWGRRRVLHAFDGPPGTVRGISPLVPALQVARQFDQLADATLTASIVQACFAASISGNEPTEEILQGFLTPKEQRRIASGEASAIDAWMDAQSGWYDAATLDLGVNGRMIHLFPGQELKFHGSQHPNASYRDFSMHLLRELARCLGLTYESATGDYEGATYSSVRMAVNEIFAITSYRRRNIVAPFCQAAYETWLEEDIENGGTPFPGGIDAFLAQKNAACRAAWRGAPRPAADELKTAKALEVYKRMGVVSDEMIAADLGVDIEDVYAQRAKERELRESLGLNEMFDPVTGQDLPDAPEDPEDKS
jgi:lambda family phage portal protein